MENDFFECPNRDRKKQCKWYGSREQLLGLSVIRFGRNGINFICPTCGDSFGCPAYNIRLTSLELDNLELESPPIVNADVPIDKYEELTNRLEKLRDEWADIAYAIEKIYGDDNPAANVYRLCIGAVYKAIKGDQL